MKHFAAPSFWTAYNKLPQRVRDLADKNYALLRQNADHPSLHFKRLGRHWTVRVGLHYRAIGSEDDGTVVWFWIGSHADYDKLLEQFWNELTGCGIPIVWQLGESQDRI